MSRVALTKNQKLQLCIQRERDPSMRVSDLANWAARKFRLPRVPGESSIRKIVKLKAELQRLPAEEVHRKRKMSARVAVIDRHVVEAMALFENKVHLHGHEIIWLAELAVDVVGVPAMARPRFTRSGWLRHFLARYGIRRRRSHGEAGSVAPTVVETARKEIRRVIGLYHPSNVFNMDEAAYFFKALPSSSICFSTALALKQNKARVTMVVGTNAAGTEKLPLVILGKSKTPRWLPDKPAAVEYVGTSKGWMTVVVFQKWLVNLNEKMKEAGRKILLLFDNAPVHIEPDDQLSNVRVLRLPKNTTAVMQPMDQGVIAWVKHTVMTKRTSSAIVSLLNGDADPYQVTMIDAVEWLQETWDQLDEETIRSCWRHSGLLVDRLAVQDILN
jgi:hypothetical protein